MKKAASVILQIIGWIILGVIMLFISLTLLIQLPPVQNFIINKATTFVSSRTHTRVEMGKIKIVFPRSVSISKLFLEDKKQDTLVYLNQLDVKINLWALLNKKISVSRAEIHGLRSNIYRTKSDSSFNFQFIISAFSSSPAKQVKDTTSVSPWKFDISKIVLHHIDVDFNDSIGGTFLYGKLEELETKIEESDLQKLQFKVDYLSVSNAHSAFVLAKPETKPTQENTPSTTASIRLEANKITLNKVDFKFINESDLQNFDFKFGSSQLRNCSFDLASLTAKAGRFDLANSRIAISLGDKTPQLPQNNNRSKMIVKSIPGFSLDLEHASFYKSDFKLDLDHNPALDSSIDFRHLALMNINSKVHKVHYSDRNMRAKVESFAANERSGLSVKHFSTNFIMDNEHAEASNLYLQTSLSKITKYASVHYASWDDMSKHIGKLSIWADVENSIINFEDVLRFQPGLAHIDIIRKNIHKPVKIDAIIHGKLQDILIEKLSISAGKQTSLKANGHITGLPDIDHTKFDIQLSSLNTSHDDINTFLPVTLLSSFQLPDTIALSGSFNGTISDFDMILDAVTPDGSLKAEGSVKGLRQQPAYKIRMNMQAMNIGKILKQKPLLGKVSMQGTVNGKGIIPRDIDIQLDAKVDSFFLNKYTYSKLNIKGNVKNRLFNGHADINDPNLAFSFDGKINMDTLNNEYRFDLDLKGADLQALNFTDQDIRISASANANIKAREIDDMKGNAGVKNITLYSGGKKYEIDSLIFVTFNDASRKSFEINSAIFKAKFDGNIALASLPATLSNHFNYYFRTGKIKKGKPEHFEMEVDINNDPLIYEVLVPDMKDFIPGKIKGSFDSENRKLDFDANMISMNYLGNKVENLQLSIHSNAQSMDYSFGFDLFSNSQINMEKTALSGTVKNDVAIINLLVQDENQKNKLKVASKLSGKDEDIYRFNILPDGLAINDENWSIPQGNVIEFGKNGVYVHDLELIKNEQKISVNSTSKNQEADMDIIFRDFQLLTLSQIAEKDAPIARGKLDGNITFKKYHRQMAFVSDFTIKNAGYKDSPIGDITLKANNFSDNKYIFNALITGNDNNIGLDGYLQSHAGGMDLDLDLNLKRVNLSSFQGFASTQVTSVSGYLSGDLKITGTTTTPRVNGDVTLSKAGAQVSLLNQYMTLEESRISIDPNGIYFPNVVLRDLQKNTATIKGSVTMKDFKDLKYNIDIVTDNFMVMNSTRKNNKMLNGRMIMDSNIKVRGSDSRPDIEAKVRVGSGSSICFTVPEQQLSADKGDDVVEFEVDTTRLHPIMLKGALQKKTTTEFKGINIVANLDVNKRSTFKLVLDPAQGDSLIVKGDASLSFALDESGKMSLTGTYIVSEGSYQISLEDIINKKFYIKDGSTITWNGDPLDALVDITALYKVKTSPANLLTSGSGGKAEVDPSAAKNALDFVVGMDIKGALLSPNLKFHLDMDPSQQQALGGTVYTNLMALNTNESELDKQVFSLLVIGSFMPAGNATGGTTDYNGIARNSASSILSSQLNALSAQYIKGVELNFDLQSYNDYAAGKKTGNTQLSVGVKKQFFDDKLSVQVGSNVGLEGQKASQNNLSNFTGNVVIEYKITKSGNYRIKAFRENQYEGLIYGVVIKTGAGVIYSRDYNSIGELFMSRRRKRKIE